MEDLRGSVRIYIDSSSEYAMINELITYSIFVENNSEEDIKDLFVSINIPECSEYYDDSLISSEAYEISKTSSGIIFKELKAKSSINIFYKIEILKVPTSGAIENKNYLEYKEKEEEISLGSNKIFTKIKGALISKETDFRKSIVDGELKIGEAITFEIAIRNTGNLTAFDLFLTDVLPKNIKPLLDKVVVNNRILSLNSLKDVSLGNLGPFKTLTVRYKALVEEISAEGEYFSIGRLKYRYFNDLIGDYIDFQSSTNELDLNIKEAIINAEDDFYCELRERRCFINEEIKGCFFIKNSGNTTAKNVFLTIELPKNIFIKNNSVILKGKEVALTNLNKVNLGEIESLEEIQVNFNLSTLELNNEEKYIRGSLNYDYSNLDIGETVTKFSRTNKLAFEVLGIIINNNEKVINKSVNKKVCKVGDEVEHKVTVNNTGNLDCENVILKELEEHGNEFLKQSIKINGKSINSNLVSSIPIGTIKAGEQKEISYRSKITDIPIDDTVRSRAYIEFNDENSMGSSSKKKIWCKENEIKVIGANVQGEIEVNDYYNFFEDKINCKLTVRNAGNKKAFNVKPIILPHPGIIIEKFSYVKNSEVIEGIGSNLAISSLEPLETVVFNLEVIALEEEIINNLFLMGEIQYFYFEDENERDIENKKSIIEKKYLKVNYPNLELGYESSVKALEVNEEFSVNLKIKNTGNINFNNLKIKEVIPKSLELLYANEYVENNYINLGILRVAEEKDIALVFKVKEKIEDNDIELVAKVEYEYLNEKLIRGYKQFESFKLELNNSYLDLILDSEKENILESEEIKNTIKIKNNGNYKLKDGKLYLYTNRLNDVRFIESLIINNKICKLNRNDNSIDLGDLEPESLTYIKFNAKSTISKKIKFYGKVTGYYEFKTIKERREKSFYSNEVEVNINKVSLNSFLSADKEVVYKGEALKYSSVIINDGTVPLDFSYKLNKSNALEFIEKSFIVNGLILDEDKIYEGTIEPSEGIVIEKSYFYDNAFGGNKVFAEAIINYKYRLDSNEQEKTNEIKTEKVFVEAASTTFKEVFIEHKEKLINFEEEVVTISNVYAVPTIFDYYLVDKFKKFNTGSSIISSNKVVIRGILTLKIEYISKTNNVYIHNKHLEFLSFMILPREYKAGEKIDLKVNIEDVYYKIVDLSYLFLNVNMIIKALF